MSFDSKEVNIKECKTVNYIVQLTGLTSLIITDIRFPLQTLSDEAAKVVYQMKRASSVSNNKSNTMAKQKKTARKKRALVEEM